MRTVCTCVPTPYGHGGCFIHFSTAAGREFSHGLLTLPTAYWPVTRTVRRPDVLVLIRRGKHALRLPRLTTKTSSKVSQDRTQAGPGASPPPPLPSTTTLSRRHVHSLTVHVQQKTDRGWAWLGLLKVTCDSSNVRLKGRVLKVIEVVCD